MENSIIVIHPYREEGIWVFDDDRIGLVKEPFVSGSDDIIDKMVEAIPDAQNGFSLIFSKIAFPGSQLELVWKREEAGGNWYYSKELDMEGWLCPALLKYFKEAPQTLFAQFREKNNANSAKPCI